MPPISLCGAMVGDGLTSSETMRANSSEVAFGRPGDRRDHLLGPAGTDRSRGHRAQGNGGRPVWSLVTTEHTVAITMAFLTPTLPKCCRSGRSSGSRTEVISSPASRAVFFTPAKNWSHGMDRGAGIDSNSIEASTAARKGSPSPAGLAVPTIAAEGPRIPDLRRADGARRLSQGGGPIALEPTPGHAGADPVLLPGRRERQSGAGSPRSWGGRDRN